MADKEKSKTFLVVGLGVFGVNLCRYLKKLGYSVAGMDKNQNAVDNMKNEIEILFVGDATSEETLKEIDIPSFDTCIVCFSEHIGDTILAVDNLKRSGAKYVIAKASNEKQENLLRKIGADDVIIPEKEAAFRLAYRLTHLSLKIQQFVVFGDNEILEEVQAPKFFWNKTIRELDLRKKFGITVLAIKRGTKVKVNPLPDEKIEEGDWLVIFGTKEDLSKIANLE